MKNNLEKIIKESLIEILEDNNMKIEITNEVTLIGENAILDSFDFVNLTIAIEEKVSDEFDIEITLVNPKAFSRKNSPFKNVKLLTEYVAELLEEK